MLLFSLLSHRHRVRSSSETFKCLHQKRIANSIYNVDNTKERRAMPIPSPPHPHTRSMDIGYFLTFCQYNTRPRTTPVRRFFIVHAAYNMQNYIFFFNGANIS